jgi:hypothetical protein
LSLKHQKLFLSFFGFIFDHFLLCFFFHHEVRKKKTLTQKLKEPKEKLNEKLNEKNG